MGETTMGGEWLVLARREGGAGVSRCPEGHIHVEYGVVSLRFDDAEFLAFAGTLGEAVRNITGLSEPDPDRRIPRPDRTRFSPN